MAISSSPTAWDTAVPATLGAILGDQVEHVETQRCGPNGAVVVVLALGRAYAVHVSRNTSLGTVAAQARQLAEATNGEPSAFPLLAVPYMSEAGRRACEAARVSWFDFSGNAHIVAPGLRVIVQGRPNLFRGPGRPFSVFAPKSARVVRWLLMQPDRAFTQREIARGTHMTEGFVSRIVTRLEADQYLIREASPERAGKGPIRVRDPSLLLDAWREEYQLSKHTMLQGHVAARSGDALTRFVGDTLSAAGLEHAATGLAAAWYMTHFAGFRTSTFFVADLPSAGLKQRLGFREDPRGANLWLLVPNDAGVFQGAAEQQGLRCVHPVQAYLDLKGHPERASEAAAALRAELLRWGTDA